MTVKVQVKRHLLQGPVSQQLCHKLRLLLLEPLLSVVYQALLNGGRC